MRSLVGAPEGSEHSAENIRAPPLRRPHGRTYAAKWAAPRLLLCVRNRPSWVTPGRAGL